MGDKNMIALSHSLFSDSQENYKSTINDSCNTLQLSYIYNDDLKPLT